VRLKKPPRPPRGGPLKGGSGHFWAEGDKCQGPRRTFPRNLSRIIGPRGARRYVFQIPTIMSDSRGNQLTRHGVDELSPTSCSKRSMDRQRRYGMDRRNPAGWPVDTPLRKIDGFAPRPPRQHDAVAAGRAQVDLTSSRNHDRRLLFASGDVTFAGTAAPRIL